MTYTRHKTHSWVYLRLVCILLLLVSCFTTGLAQNGIYYSVKLLPDKVTYQVSLSSTVGLSGTDRITNTGQVTIVVPTGSFQVANVQSTNGGWTNNTTVLAPPQSPNYDYFIFGLTPNAPSIPYSATQETVLFTFTNSGPCVGPVEIWTSSDLFQPNPPTQPINVGNDLTALGFRANGTVYNAWKGNYNVGSANCAIPPTIAILSPVTNTTVAGPSIAVSGTVTAGASVTLTEGATVLCSTTGTGGGIWSCSVSLPDGLHTLTAIAKNSGGTSTPATTTFTILTPVNPDCKPICVPITITRTRRRGV
ncbi:hypothetical protein GO755_05590 [Spirosoma sp. HMF4905]|uniref:Bacterial Ig-like domain-containing protein n=1 Tax=Spirosoma arboris TaxID=2682092 RepID=A0A7K1S7E5_9BACT|nr:hypothetical protein [Spirosoma arboris]MVM29496.1 hypothetical protein [Spirosoma arboris]